MSECNKNLKKLLKFYHTQTTINRDAPPKPGEGFMYKNLDIYQGGTTMNNSLLHLPTDLHHCLHQNEESYYHNYNKKNITCRVYNYDIVCTSS